MRKQPVTLNVTDLEMRHLSTLQKQHNITRSDVIRVALWRYFDAELGYPATMVDSIEYTIGRMVDEKVATKVAEALTKYKLE